MTNQGDIKSDEKVENSLLQAPILFFAAYKHEYQGVRAIIAAKGVQIRIDEIVLSV